MTFFCVPCHLPAGYGLTEPPPIASVSEVCIIQTLMTRPPVPASGMCPEPLRSTGHVGVWMQVQQPPKQHSTLSPCPSGLDMKPTKWVTCESLPPPPLSSNVG